MTERRPAVLLAGLFVILFTATVDSQLLIPLLPLLSLDLSTRLSTLGLLFSVYALAATMANVLLGPLSDRRGRVGFLRLGILLLGAAALAAQWSRTFPVLLVVRAAAGVAGGLISVCSATSAFSMIARRSDFSSAGSRLASPKGFTIFLPFTIRLDPTINATGTIEQTWAVGIPAPSIAFANVAPQRVLVPQVDVRITPSTPPFLSSTAIACPI